MVPNSRGLNEFRKKKTELLPHQSSIEGLKRAELFADERGLQRDHFRKSHETRLRKTGTVVLFEQYVRRKAQRLLAKLTRNHRDDEMILEPLRRNLRENEAWALLCGLQVSEWKRDENDVKDRYRFHRLRFPIL